MQKEDYKIVPFSPKEIPTTEKVEAWDIDFEPKIPRFAIADTEGKIIDDAQGYGYKSKQNAFNAMSYKFLGGKQKENDSKIKFSKWKSENPIHKEIVEKFSDYLKWYFKEIARGETTEKEIWSELETEYGIKVPDSIKKQIIKQL